MFLIKKNNRFLLFFINNIKEVNMNHDYHFVVTCEMKTRISDFAVSMDLSLSSTVIFILRKIQPVIDRYHYISPEKREDGEYRFINSGADLHVFMENGLYRKIKLIHSTMNFFSMAIIVRWMIDLFFELIDKYGKKKFYLLIRKFNGINDVRFYEGREWEKAEYSKHMSHIKPIIDLYSLTFSTDYRLKKFKIHHLE